MTRRGYHRQGPLRTKSTSVIIATNKHAPETNGSPCGQCTRRKMTKEELLRYGPPEPVPENIQRIRTYLKRNKAMQWIGLNNKQNMDDEATARIEHIREKMHGD